MNATPSQDESGVGTYVGDGVFITTLDHNGFRTPIELCPANHGQIIFANDLSPSETPAPFRYEIAPLRWTIQHAHRITILPYSIGDDTHPPCAHASDRDRKLLTLDVYLGAAHRQENSFLIRTLWPWLAPWENAIQREKLPRTVVTVLDHAGERRILSRATAKPARSPRRRDNSKRKG